MHVSHDYGKVYVFGLKQKGKTNCCGEQLSKCSLVCVLCVGLMTFKNKPPFLLEFIDRINRLNSLRLG